MTTNFSAREYMTERMTELIEAVGPSEQHKQEMVTSMKIFIRRVATKADMTKRKADEFIASWVRYKAFEANPDQDDELIRSYLKILSNVKKK